jgi:hypothetical protein
MTDSEFGALGDASEAAHLLEVIAAEGVVRGLPRSQVVLDWLQDVRSACERKRASLKAH